MIRAVALVLAGLLVTACSGTPLPGDDDEPEELAPISLDSPSLNARQGGRAVQMLVEHLAALEEEQRRLFTELERPDLAIDQAEPAQPFRRLIAEQYAVGRLAELLYQLAEQQGRQSAALDTTVEAFRGLATLAYLQVVDTLDLQKDLVAATLSSNAIRAGLEEAFHSLHAPSSNDEVVLLPEDATRSLLILSSSDSEASALAEEPSGFGGAVSAVDLESAARLVDRSAEVSDEAMRQATLNRLALLSKQGTLPPHSSFARYAQTVPHPDSFVYDSRGEKTAGLPEGGDWLLAVTSTDAGFIRATLLDVVRDAEVASTTAVASHELTAAAPDLPSFGRPFARVAQAGRAYRLTLDFHYVNPAGVRFVVTCTVPALGARATTAIDGSAASGAAGAASVLTLAPTVISSFASGLQFVCADTYGTIETGRIDTSAIEPPPDQQGNGHAALYLPTAPT